MKRLTIFLILVIAVVGCAQNELIRQDSLRASEVKTKSAVIALFPDTTNVHNVSYANRDSIIAQTLLINVLSDTNAVYRGLLNTLLDSATVHSGNITTILDTLSAHLSSILTFYDSLAAHLLRVVALEDSIQLYAHKSGETFTGNVKTKKLYSDFATISASDIDCDESNNFIKTISTNTNFTVSNMTAGQVINIAIINSGSYTLGWSTTVLWSGGVAPTLTVSGTDIFTLIKIGSNIYGTYVQDLQ